MIFNFSLFILFCIFIVLVECRTKVRVVVIGGGIAGHTAVYELASHGIGNSSNPGKSGGKGIMLFEKEKDHYCGIIEPITYDASTGIDNENFGYSENKGSPFIDSYRPIRGTTHAMRINIATQAALRCLANELSIPLYFTPWATEYRMGGYKAYNGRFECKPNANINNGFQSSCRASCAEEGPNELYENDSECSHNWGSADLVTQSSSVGNKGLTFWNYDPENNYNQGDYDPEDEFYGWALGYANYYNPTANYDGEGSVYNNASPYPFQPDNPSQDHPRHQCAKFQDLYSMYQYYLGPEYAEFICDVNAGFRGDCNVGSNPCQYIGSATETGWLAREYQTIDEGYPVGSMTELCTRQKWLAENNDKDVPVTYHLGEKVLSIDDGGNHGKYLVTTNKRKVFCDEIIIGAEPESVMKIKGKVIEKIVSQPEFNFPQNVPVVTITVHWSKDVPNYNWMDTITGTLYSSYRMLNTGSCINRIEILNDPYHRNIESRMMRATYTDYTCLNNWLALIRIYDPKLEGKYSAQEGIPLDSVLAQEQMRELRQLFMGGGPYSFYNISSIPDPDKVSVDYEPYSWYEAKAGTPFTMKHTHQWATRPLQNHPGIMLNHQAWNMIYSGWVLSSINQTRAGLLKMYGNPYFSAEEYEERHICNPNWKENVNVYGDDWSAVYENPCDPYKLSTEQSCDPSYGYSTPGIDAQIDYNLGMPNEHFPPYSWDEEVQWQAPSSS